MNQQKLYKTFFLVLVIAVLILLFMPLFNGTSATWKVLNFFHWFDKTETQKISLPTDIEKAIHGANLTRTEGYLEGELAVEGHVILGSEINENVTTVFTVSSWGWFAFENGIFTIVSGAFRVPAAITFTKNDSGEYTLQNYQKPLDGSGHGESLKKLFPSKYRSDANHRDKFNDELTTQQETQASEYLKSIGRTANINASHVEKVLPNIDVEASNKLLEIISDNAKMNNFPYWLGTQEYLEHETRYIYETSQNKTTDGYDLMIYTKKKGDGKIVEIYRYKIVGADVFLQ